MMRSPYFDLSLFSYDEKVVSPVVGRPCVCMDGEARFYARHPPGLKFALDATSGMEMPALPCLALPLHD